MGTSGTGAADFLNEEAVVRTDYPRTKLTRSLRLYSENGAFHSGGGPERDVSLWEISIGCQLAFYGI